MAGPAAENCEEEEEEESREEEEEESEEDSANMPPRIPMRGDERRVHWEQFELGNRGPRTPRPLSSCKRRWFLGGSDPRWT